MSLTSEKRVAISDALEANPGAVIEFLAKEHGVSPAEIIACLPEGQATNVGGENFETVMTEIADCK